jgi:hypothetical protein
VSICYQRFPFSHNYWDYKTVISSYKSNNQFTAQKFYDINFRNLFQMSCRVGKMCIVAVGPTAAMAMDQVAEGPSDAAQNPEEVKMVITGDDTVGKSCMLNSYSKNALP